MRVIAIPKRNGKFRTIYVPSADEKQVLKRLVPALNRAAQQADVHGVMHGFMPGRSPVTNAMAHRGYAYTLSFDLEDFFDSVLLDMVHPPHLWRVGTSLPEIESCFVDGAARQGLPTSPALSNIAVAPMVNEIMGLRNSQGRFRTEFAFSIYADDMSFSFERLGTAAWLKQVIPEIVERHGFKINPAKTHLQSAQSGRRMITGVAVDGEIHTPRSIKRRIRAAKHRGNQKQHDGLSEWAKLKLPAGANTFVQRAIVAPVVATLKQISTTTQHVANTFGSWARKIL